MHGEVHRHEHVLDNLNRVYSDTDTVEVVRTATEVEAELIDQSCIHGVDCVAALELDRDTGTFEKKIDGLTRPHGGMEYSSGLLATDTAGGAVVRQDENTSVRYDFTTMPGKAEGTENMEWLQTSHFADNTIITIDSNRTSFVLFDPEAGKRAIVPFSADWAVQDFVLLKGNQEALYTKIKNYFR